MSNFQQRIDASLADVLNSATHLESFFINVRKRIEQDKTQNNYPLLFFFCNWVMHDKLDRGEFILSFLDNLSNIWVTTKGVDNLINAIQKVLLNYELLREEIISFLEKENLNFKNFNKDTYWKSFLFSLLELLSGIPLIRKSQKSNITLPDYVDSFSIVSSKDNSDEILMIIAGVEGGFTYHMQTRNGPDLVGTIRYLRDL